MKPTWCMLIVVSANVAMAAAGVMDFSAGQPADYFSDDTAGRVQISSVGDTQVMVVSDAPARFHDVKVKPSTKYTLKLEAAFQGDVESIEENPRFEIFTRLGQTSTRLPSRDIRFFDAAGKPVGRSMVYAMPFKNRRIDQDIFYTPADAASARISLASGKGVRLVLSQLSFAEADDEAALNVNPTFQLGPYNYSGWQSISAGGQLIEREGKTILDTKYGSTGQMIPLSEPGTYAFSAKATANGYNSVVIVRVYDALGKELMRSSTRRYGPRTYFVPPKNAAYASFLVYSCLLEEVKLLRVGNERAIESLQGDP
ncbi:MAG TPA: hypothetical protein VMY42_08360 [Thermoguttaceae bacterium]|nr:hypothetical protein [Thermoguttaceae bacterium]